MISLWGNLKRGITTLADGAVDLVLPQACGACQSPDVSINHLCTECHVQLLSLVSLPYCWRCGASVGPNVPVRPDGCPACPNPLPRFERVFRIGSYAGPIRQTIRSMKYRRNESLQQHLCHMLASRIEAESQETDFDLIMPIPMHWRRRLVRGYDHSRAIARMLGKHMGLAVGNELVRVRNTPPQVHLSRSSRIANVRGAFKVNRPEPLEGSRILLVDDVTTTGATACEAASVLKRAGVLHVCLAVLAKSEPPSAYSEQLNS